MPIRGTRILFICHNYGHDDEDAFNEWYIREHLPERVNGLPGFNRGRRYRSISDGPDYAAFYEVDDAAALGTPEYLKIVENPDPRSRHFIPRFQSPTRTVSRVVASAGVGEGGILGVVAFEHASSAPPVDADALVAEIQRAPGVIAAHLTAVDQDALDQSRRRHLRQGDRVFVSTLLVETITPEAFDALRGSLLTADRLGAIGEGAPAVFGTYRLLFSLSAGG